MSYTGSERFGAFSILFIPLVRLHLELFHEFFKVNPFNRRNHFKLKAEFMRSAPPDNRRLNMNWRFTLFYLDPNIQRGSWMRVERTFDATTPNGEIDDTTLSADFGGGRKRAAKFDRKPELLSLLHNRAPTDWYGTTPLYCQSGAVPPPFL